MLVSRPARSLNGAECCTQAGQINRPSILTCHMFDHVSHDLQSRNNFASDIFRASHGVDGNQDSTVAVPVHDRMRDIVVQIEAFTDDVLGVVAPMLDRRPGDESADEFVVVGLQVQRDVSDHVELASNLIHCARLFQVAGDAVENVSGAIGFRVPERHANHVKDDPVRNEFATGEVGLDAAPSFGLPLDVVAEQVAGRDVRDVEMGGDEDALRTFTSPWRGDHENPHNNSLSVRRAARQRVAFRGPEGVRHDGCPTNPLCLRGRGDPVAFAGLPLHPGARPPCVPLPSYPLPFVAAQCEVDLVHHHNASDDVRCAAQIAVAIAGKQSADTLPDLAESCGIRIGHMQAGFYSGSVYRGPIGEPPEPVRGLDHRHVVGAGDVIALASSGRRPEYRRRLRFVPATLRRPAAKSVLLAPTAMVTCGTLEVPVYGAAVVARLHAHLESEEV